MVLCFPLVQKCCINLTPKRTLNVLLSSETSYYLVFWSAMSFMRGVVGLVIFTLLTKKRSMLQNFARRLRLSEFKWPKFMLPKMRMISSFPWCSTILNNLVVNLHTLGKDVHHQFVNLYQFRSNKIHQAHGHLGHKLQRTVHLLLYQVKMATVIASGHKLLQNHLLLRLALGH